MIRRLWPLPLVLATTLSATAFAAPPDGAEPYEDDGIEEIVEIEEDGAADEELAQEELPQQAELTPEQVASLETLTPAQVSGEEPLTPEQQAALELLTPEQQQAIAQAVLEQPGATDDEAAAVGMTADGEVTDPKLYAEYIRAIIASKREAVEEKIMDRVIDKQVARMDMVSGIFSIVSALALGLLLMPLILRKRYPGKSGVLWKYSAISALLFFVTINLFAGVLSVLRVGQMVGGGMTNPQVQIVQATFDTIDENAEDIAPMGPVLIEPTLAALQPGSEDPLPVLLLNNVQKFNNELTVFKKVASFFKSVNWVFGYLPIVLSLVTVAVFLLGLKPTLMDIIKLPIRAASGEQGVARKVTKSTLRRVGWELVTTFAIMFVLLFVMVFAGLFLAEALKPALEAFIAYLGVAFIYVQIVPDASSAAVLTALGGTVLFLVLDLAVVLAASALFIGKAHKIFQRRFHDKEPLRAHGRFWKWGTLSMVYALVFPLLYIFAAQPLVEAIIEWQMADGENVSWGSLLVVGPVLLVVLFLASAWLFRVHKAIGFIAKYKVPKVGQPVGASMPVRSGLTAPHATVDTPPVAPEPDYDAEWELEERLAAAEQDDPYSVPVRTGMTQAHPSVRKGAPKTTRYRSVD